VTGEQIFIFVVLAVTLGLFIWGRWRYDIVALMALVAVLLAGIVPAQDAFVGFGHPAVVTVAAVLVISQTLQNSGLLGWIARQLATVSLGPSLQVGAVAGIVAAFSAFMNNVGALALLLPVVIQVAKKTKREPRDLLMPLAFGSLLGGLITVIGTPPNIIIATIRAGYADDHTPFGMFDFTPVGIVIAIAGVLFVALAGWRLIPKHDGPSTSGRVFEIEDYITEVRIPPKTPLIGKSIREAHGLGVSDDIVFVTIHRRGRQIHQPSPDAVLRSGDHLLIEGDANAIEETVKATQLALVGSRALDAEVLKSGNIGMVETVVTPRSQLINRSARQAQLATRHHMNLIAIARHGRAIRRRLNQVRFQAGDVLLLQGDTETMPDALSELDCLPLANRELTLHQAKSYVPAVIFAIAICASALGFVTVPVAFVTAVVAMLATGQITPRSAYNAIDWPIIVLLGAMVPVGDALATTGASALIADIIAGTAAYFPPWGVLLLVLVGTMLLSDIINNAATALLMGPLAAEIALRMKVSPDPFLMAVAIGASCAFLTPIGHQSNVLVMGPGGYRFRDYWPMGLPLEAVICVVAIPMILWAWPL
jgi:di/tricarboxylate transporter